MVIEKSNSAKDFLKQVQLYDMHINEKLEEMEHLKALTLKITATWKQDTISGSGNLDKLGDAVSKIVDLENEINKAIDIYIDKKKVVNAVIEQIQDPDQVAVLYKRYFQYESLEQIACELHCTYRNVCYIHGKALQAVSLLIDEK